MRLNCLLFNILLCILLTWGGLYAAEIRNGSLWLEISLHHSSQVNIRQTGSANLTDDSGIYSRDVSSDIDIRISGSPVSHYGIIDRVVTAELDYSDSDDYSSRSFFAWEDSTLAIKEEHIYLLDMSFTTEEAATSFARENRIASTMVYNVPMSGSTLEITDSSGRKLYFESPVRLRANSPLSFDNSGLKYSGEFIIKVIGNQIQVNHLINLENYLAGVVQNEIGNGAPLEALKAQAVAARSHAVSMLLYNRHKNDGYDLCNGTHCQVYKGEYLQNANILEAVLSTGGEILSYNGRAIDATYHSACGGKTDSSQLIWRGTPTPYLMGVTCIDDADNLDLSREDDARRWINTSTNSSGMSSWERASQTWTRSIRLSTLASNLGLSSISRAEILARGQSGRILSIRFTGSSSKTVTGEYQIRRAFGSLPSSLFFIDGRYSINSNGNAVYELGANLRIKGKGSGHGVGMCQVGALRMSRDGADYREILSHYYPGTLLRTDWLNYE